MTENCQFNLAHEAKLKQVTRKSEIKKERKVK